LKYIFEGDIINCFYDIMSKNFLYFSVLAGWLAVRSKRSEKLVVLVVVGLAGWCRVAFR
jgi:hypothetical protein